MVSCFSNSLGTICSEVSRWSRSHSAGVRRPAWMNLGSRAELQKLQSQRKLHLHWIDSQTVSEPINDLFSHDGFKLNDKIIQYFGVKIFLEMIVAALVLCGHLEHKYYLAPSSITIATCSTTSVMAEEILLSNSLRRAEFSGISCRKPLVKLIFDQTHT